jgi:curved DNA-binding protein CbpA
MSSSTKFSDFPAFDSNNVKQGTFFADPIRKSSNPNSPTYSNNNPSYPSPSNANTTTVVSRSRSISCLGLLHSLRLTIELTIKALTLLAWCIMITLKYSPLYPARNKPKPAQSSSSNHSRVPSSSSSSSSATAASWPPLLTFYDILNVAEGASSAEIKSAHRRLAIRYHPDKNVGAGYDSACEQFIKVQEAYEILSDQLERKRYDYSLKGKVPYTKLPIAIRTARSDSANSATNSSSSGNNSNNSTENQSSARSFSRYSNAFYTQKRPPATHGGLHTSRSYNNCASAFSEGRNNAPQSEPSSPNSINSARSSIPTIPTSASANNIHTKTTEPGTPDSPQHSNCSTTPQTPNSAPSFNYFPSRSNSTASSNSNASLPNSSAHSSAALAIIQLAHSFIASYFSFSRNFLLFFVFFPFKILSVVASFAWSLQPSKPNNSFYNNLNNHVNNNNPNRRNFA